MDIEKIRDIMVFACNALVFAHGNITWSVYDCTLDVKMASKCMKNVKILDEALLGYCITCYPSYPNIEESYDIRLVPVVKSGKICIIIFKHFLFPEMNCYFFHEDIHKMHSELNRLYEYVGSYIRGLSLCAQRSAQRRAIKEYKKDFCEDLLKELVDWMIKTCSGMICDHDYQIFYSDIERDFVYADKNSGTLYRLSKEILKANNEAILKEIDSRKGISLSGNTYYQDNPDGFVLILCSCNYEADEYSTPCGCTFYDCSECGLYHACCVD